MANATVKVLSARYVFGGKTYTRGDTFEVAGDAKDRSTGINDSLARGNIIMIAATDVVNAATTPTGQVQVDLGTVSSKPGDWPDPRTTDVTGGDFPVEEGADIPEVAPNDFIGNALKSAVKETTAKAPAKKPARSPK